MQENPEIKDTAVWLETVIKDFVNQSPENTLQNPANDKAFDEPLVGFSSGDDPIYQAFKEHVGLFHWTPLEIFNLTFPQMNAGTGELTVISWILPQTAKTKADNKKKMFFPSESWARARKFGEAVNESLRKHVVDTLRAAGIEAVAPVLSPEWAMKMSERYLFASTWSERHAAYVSGLGTFGLCDGLITHLGKAVRCGSVVARIQIAPTPRPYKDHHEYCLFFSRGICKKCIKRCPAGSLSERGHDKLKCSAYVMKEMKEYVTHHFGFEAYACGLCQTGVPCESRIPLSSA